MQSWTKKTAFTLEDIARDTMAIVDHLKLKKVHVIGASMGGMITQRMAIDFP
ncbi:MAG: pimeloyl-ACP methyl ester carboxylesterase [Flavobacteriaceae bacterium]|jgi:pimeloyl-ACP methyl ester carboxylesterase|tara:strand:- start:1176 stop:1331 length:156 start_codon:yes stop_codon:yes gene_type:complete